MILPKDRFDFSPIRDRKPWKLPKGARVAVYTVVNVEDWDFEKAVPRQYVPAPQGVVTVPDVQNWAWHEYGMRVGIWRLLEALTKRGLKASAPVNARVCSTYEPVARAMLEAGWEFMGHGVVQGAMHVVPDQRSAIFQSMELLHRFTGKRPQGWLGPGMHETSETLDLLAEAGFKYVCDWALDEQPFKIRTSSGDMVSMPYTLEISDLPMMAVHHHDSKVWFTRAKDHFDRLNLDGRKSARVMSLSVHPYISGVAHRIRYFEDVYDYLRKQKGVWMTTAAEIHDWFVSNH
jgi:peptidoglycan/xylan/chitin deacetylase (PgdA/CDA1 family)